MENKILQATWKSIRKPFPMFMLGVLSMILVLLITPTIAENAQLPNDLSNDLSIQSPASETERNKPSPQEYISEEQIKVYNDRVIIQAENIKWAGFTDTKSMLPVLNKDSNALQIEPVCPEEIAVGDIVSYRSDYAEGIIIHRVVYASEDEEGPYFILKGDNNPSNDPGKIRCEQIERKVVAIIY